MGITTCSNQGRSYIERSFCLSLHYRHTVITLCTVQIRSAKTLSITGVPGYPYHPEVKDRHCSILGPSTYPSVIKIPETTFQMRILFLEPLQKTSAPAVRVKIIDIIIASFDKSTRNLTNTFVLCLQRDTPKKQNCGHCGTFIGFDPCACM